MSEYAAKAAVFAARAHYLQRRKYSHEPYINHPARVAASVAHNIEWFSGEAWVPLAAAWLHDVVEDCKVPLDILEQDFTHEVSKIVEELTNPSHKYPELRRASRKQMDRDHLASVSTNAQLIKVFDRIDNLKDIIKAPRDFAALYLDESEALASILDNANATAHKQLLYAIRFARKKLTIADCER